MAGVVDGVWVGDVQLSPGWPKFVQAIGAVFHQWTCLHLAVEQQWGGMSSREKADTLMSNTLSMFAAGAPAPHRAGSSALLCCD